MRSSSHFTNIFLDLVLECYSMLHKNNMADLQSPQEMSQKSNTTFLVHFRQFVTAFHDEINVNFVKIDFDVN